MEWTDEAWAELRRIRVFDRRHIVRAADALACDAESETRNRKPLQEPLEDLPRATWEVRIQSKYRLLYCIERSGQEEKEGGTVQILRAIIKERATTAEALEGKT